MHQRKRQPPPPPPPPPPPSRPPSTTGAAVMDAKQLIATLPSYISLYTHRANPSPNTNRTSILKWFASLSPPKRLSHLTIVDHAFTQILLQMASEARNGHMTFILLPDIPSRDPPHLPSLCSRRCQGLLARIADSDEPGQVIRGLIRVFNSKEGEDIRECRCRSDYLDTVSFSEEFVEDVDRFVEVMDRVSDMGFLNGSDWGELGEEWVELGWLKAKGYYSMEAFVVNRVEVALRFAWLNCNNGKKRGVKLKEKASSRVGVGANVYWRKKGCVDWWERLDDEVKRKALRMVLGKGAKSLTGEILSIAAKTGGEEMWPLTRRADRPLRSTYHAPSGRDPQDAEFGLKMTSGSWSFMPTSLACVSNGLFVLQDIVSLVATCQHGELDKEKLFYSSLDSISTLSDCILRKLRGLLMVISLDSTKIELLEEEDLKFSPNKSKEKLAATSRKKKGKNRNTKKSKPTLNNCKDGLAPGVTTQDSGSGLANKEIMDLDVPNENDGTVVGVHGQNRLSSVVEGGTAATLVSEKVQTTNGRNRKHSNKKRNPCGRIAAASEVEKSPAKLPNVSSSCAADQSGEERLSISDHSAACDIKIAKNNSIDTHGTEHIPCQCHLTSKVSNFTDIQPDSVVGSAEGSPQMLPDCRQPLNNMKSNEEVFSKSETVNNMINSGGRPPDVAGREMQVAHDDEDSNKDPVFPNQRASASVLRETNIDGKNEFVQTAGCENRSVYSGEAVIPPGYPSYEWPTVVPRFACVNSQQLPPATDRLHLEVGHNWQNRTQQSFLQQIHQMRNSSIEGGCGRVLSQPLPVSLDWPPMVRNVNGFASSLTCNYDSGFISRRQSVLQQSLTAQNAHFSAVNNTQSSGDFFDPELTSTQEIADEYENHWVSEEEYEVHTVPSVDYNQYFGGGIMYWNPSDYPAAGFSRPPSLSSDDSSWAWREADMNRTVDDMVAFSSSYSTNGLASPSAAPFCSPFESLGPGHQPISYVRAGNDASGKILHTSPTVTDLEAEEKLPGVPSDSDAKSGDSLPYPMLRPIIIPNMSRERSRHDLRSPCVRPNRREQPRIKRPPSPVVLCVPRAPRPPPPSPVGDSRKQRGFLTVRSGSSSPRNWGIKGRHSEGSTFDEACVRMDGAEVVWPSWANKTFSGHQVIQPLPGALLQDRLIAISQLTHDQEHPDIALPLQPPELLNCPLRKASLPLMHNLLHKEIDSFCKRVAAENMMRRPHINWAVKRVTRSLQVLWPRSRTNVFGSNATGLSLPTSDVDLVVCLPPVRNLEPIKEAGILEGRNSIKETCLQHAARYLANQEWVKSDSLKTVENTAIPIIMLVVEVPHDLVVSTTSNMQTPESEATQLNNERGTSQTDTAGSDSSPSPKSPEQNNNGKDVKSVRLDISFKSPSHTGLQTTELVKELTEQFPAAIPLALVLKQFLADRSLDQSYSGGLSSYCLVLLITRFLQHEHHHGRSINQNLGSLFMDFLYFFGNVFDPRQMSISIQGSGVYMNRERGYSIDPIYIDDPLFPTNNVGKNCFRIHQCIKAFADAYSTLENELTCIANDGDASVKPQYRLLPKVIPSIGLS